MSDLAPAGSLNDERPVGAALLHPLALLALLVLVVNDHYGKEHYPGFWSGKLSDFAGVLLLPLVLAAFVDLALKRVCGRLPNPRTRNRCLVAAVSCSMLVLALPEVSPSAEAVYRFGFGVLQWPFRAIASLVSEGRLVGIRPVDATADVTDLVALPMGLVALWLGWAPDRTMVIAKVGAS